MNQVPKNADGNVKEWDAENYEQINPQLTDGSGVYAWDVGEGQWQVKFEKDGYETATTEWMDVPPEWTDVNIGMIAEAAPEVSWYLLTEDQCTVEFTQYMDPETVKDIQIKDAAGNAIAYTLSYDESEKDAKDKVLAKQYTLTFGDTKPSIGETYTITFPDSIKNYNNTSIEALSEETMCTIDRISLTTVETAKVKVNDTLEIPVRINGYTGTEKLELNVKSGYVAKAKLSEIDNTGNATITVTGLVKGETELTVSVVNSNATSTIQITVGDETVEVESLPEAPEVPDEPTPKPTEPVTSPEPTEPVNTDKPETSENPAESGAPVSTDAATTEVPEGTSEPVVSNKPSDGVASPEPGTTDSTEKPAERSTESPATSDAPASSAPDTQTTAPGTDSTGTQTTAPGAGGTGTQTTAPSTDSTGTPTGTPDGGNGGTPSGTPVPTASSTVSQTAAPAGSTSTPKPSAKTTTTTKTKQTIKVNIKDKKTYKTSKKVTVSDTNGIKTIKINSFTIKAKNKKKVSFKLSKYKKYLKKKGKWNKLVITNKKGKKLTIRFKTK